MPEPGELLYPDLTRGWDALAPPRSLIPVMNLQYQGAFGLSPSVWRNCNNVLSHDGYLQGRACIANLTLGATQPPIYPAGLAAFLKAHQGEIPIWIYTALSPIGDTASAQAGACANEYDYPGGAKTVAIVTTRGIYLSIDGLLTWKDCTPTYTTGTIAVTNGSAAIVGTGTTWAANGISPFQFITIAGVRYQLCKVTDDTHATLSAPYAGATAAGLSYSVSRTFPGGVLLTRPSLIFCRVFNQNIYVAGTFIGRADGQPKPCAIKIANILSGSPVTTYLVSNSVLQASPSQDVIAGMSDIAGLELTQDGRVVLLGDEVNVYWSSNIGDNVWSVSPGGFTSLVLLEGAAHALDKLNNNLTVHFEDGIVLGAPSATGPTGDASPPFSFQLSDAEVGCFCPRTLKTFGGVQRYVGANGGVYQYDGSRSVEISGPMRTAFLNLAKQDLRTRLHAGYSSQRGGEYTIYQEATPNTLAFTLQARYTRWWPLQFPIPIGAVSDRDDRAVSALNSQQLIGIPSIDSNDGTARSVLWGLSEQVSVDAPGVFQGGQTGGFFVETDDLDFGDPLAFKFLRRIVLWVRGESADPEQLMAMVSRDGGLTFPAFVQKISQAPPSGETPMQFCFAELDGTSPVPAGQAPPGHILRCRIATVNPASLKSFWTRLLLLPETSGAIDAVSL